MTDKDAKYTPSNVVFDIGNATRKSIFIYLLDKVPALQCGQKSEWNNSNGSLMRILPIALYCELSFVRNFSLGRKVSCIENRASLTHTHKRSMIGCGIFYFVVAELLKERSKDALLRGLRRAQEFHADCDEFSHYKKLYSEIAKLTEDEIRGSGYVVNTQMVFSPFKKYKNPLALERIFTLSFCMTKISLLRHFR